MLTPELDFEPDFVTFDMILWYDGKSVWTPTLVLI